jgi:hypothetical protein
MLDSTLGTRGAVLHQVHGPEGAIRSRLAWGRASRTRLATFSRLRRLVHFVETAACRRSGAHVTSEECAHGQRPYPERCTFPPRGRYLRADPCGYFHGDRTAYAGPLRLECMSGNSTNGQCDIEFCAVRWANIAPCHSSCLQFRPSQSAPATTLGHALGQPIARSAQAVHRRPAVPAAAGDRAAGDRQMQAHSAVSSAGLRA